MDKRVAKSIVYAQVASDGGKGIGSLYDISPDAYLSGYAGKDEHIWTAIRRIQKLHGKSGFSFYVTDGGCTPYLVYFNYKIGGVRRQISFHSFDDRLLGLWNTSASARHATHWDKACSRDNARELWEVVVMR